MPAKKNILKRLNILCAAFIAFIIIALITHLFSHDFMEGFKEGVAESAKSGNSSALDNRLFGVPLKRSAGDYNMPLYVNADSTVHINARITEVDVEFVNSGSASLSVQPWGILLFLFNAVCYLAIFVVLIIVMLSLRTSIIQGNVFSRSNIKLIRSIGILLIVSSLVSDLSRYVEIRTAAFWLRDTELHILPGGITFRDLITGVLILVIAEIFAIGYDLTEENKLTI